MSGFTPLTGSLSRTPFHDLHTRSTELFVKEALTDAEYREKAALDAEMDKRNREREAYGLGFICEADMARWGIEYSDCIDYPSR